MHQLVRSRFRYLAFGLAAALCAGCAGTRAPRTEQEMLEARALTESSLDEARTRYNERVCSRARARQALDPAKPVFIDILVISGGGDWGAFGAGFLKGWSRVRGPMAMPEFDVITGVSTGALIAPFAFVASPESLDTVATLYRKPQRDWVVMRWPLHFLPSNQSLARIPGLERELKERVDMRLIQQMAEASRQGRYLIVNTTDVDDGSSRIFDVGLECEHALESGDPARVHQILLASSGIPGVFPFREIDGTMYVDGAVTGNILYGGATQDDRSLPAVWTAMFPKEPMPTIRYWVIFNNKLRARPTVTPPTWLGVITRSVELSTRYSTVTSIRHLFAMARISEAMHGARIEVRLVSVPNEFRLPSQGEFVPENMNALADLGEKLGGESASWMTQSP